MSGKVKILRDTDDVKTIYIFFTTNGTRTYVRPGDWVIKDSSGDFKVVDTDSGFEWAYHKATILKAQPWYRY